jgi:hypothetical protein
VSVLLLKARPLLAFDANNRQHRNYYAEFVKHKTWGYCPIRFAVGGSRIDLVTHIERELVDFYTLKEFKVKNTLR